MWDLRTANPLGSLSMRKLLGFVAALIVTVFAYNLFTPAVHAADEATWNGTTIQYNGHQYFGPSTVTSKTGPSLAQKTTYYQYTDIPSNNSANNTHTKAYVIYFAPGVDPGKATKANYREYSYDTSSKTYSKPSSAKSIAIDPTTADKPTTSCVYDAVGWVICSATDFLAKGMDWVFNVLSGFMAVQPIQTSQDTSLYRAWNVMRGIANIAFVIAFLIIIYSQVTSIGVSNYGIKKLIPRLIIAAVLVNVSYFICSIAVDLSNILGYSLQQIFINMRNLVVGPEGNGWNMINWQSLATLIMSGGAVGVGAAVGIHAATVALAGEMSGGIYLLLPVLLAGLLAVLVVIAILAARQALITILIILAPLAFVAYLLPNTEKWFEKWRETLMTMLILFPLFSIVFGGSQLAGEVIIQNANSIATIILGLAVQVAPLFVTPLLIKYGGSLLGKIAGIVNNPSKGVIDRTRNWANERLAEKNALAMRTNRQRAKDGTLRRRNAFRRNAIKLDDLKRSRERLKAVNESHADSLFNETEQGARLHTAEHVASTEKERVENALKAHIQGEINIPGSELHLQNVELEASKVRLAVQSAITEEQLDNYKTELGQPGANASAELARAARAIQVSNEQLALHGIAKQNAGHVKQKELAELLAVDDSDKANANYARSQQALNIAAGIDPEGRFNAQSDAMSNLIKLESEGLTKSLQYLNARAISKGTTLNEYTARIVNEAKVGEGGHADNIVKAALEQQLIEGQVGMAEDALGSYHIDQKMVADVIARNSGTMKAKGGYHVQKDPMYLSKQAIKADNPNLSEAEIDQIFKERLANGRMATLGDASGKDIAGWKVGYFKKIASTIDEQVTLARQFAERTGATEDVQKNLEAAFANIYSAATSKDIEGEMSNRQDDLAHIYQTFKEKDIPLKAPVLAAYKHELPEERLLKGEPEELPE